VLAESTSGMMLLKRERSAVDAIGNHKSPRGDWDLRAHTSSRRYGLPKIRGIIDQYEKN
jgi:hypothetical protein